MMDNAITDIRVGMLFEVVTDSFLTSGTYNVIKRPVKINKHEIIEIRHPSAWHFRTEDNQYFHATPEMIRENCVIFGTILPEISFQNIAELLDILILHLYKGENIYKLFCRKGYSEKQIKNILNSHIKIDFKECK